MILRINNGHDKKLSNTVGLFYYSVIAVDINLLLPGPECRNV